MSRVALSTLLDRSIKNMGNVKIGVKQRAEELIKRAYAEGINVQISSGYRSMTAQAALYGQGRSSYVYQGKQYGNPRMQRVTNAKPGQSNHNFGLAIDFFLTTRDGKSATWNVNSDWRRVAAIGKAMGFKWGGDWTSFKDYPHLELSSSLAEKPFNGYSGTATASASTTKSNVLRKGDNGSAVKEMQELLLKAGEKLPRFGADSDFGDETENALKSFQSKAKIEVDGIYGPNSKKTLEEATKPKSTFSTIRPGSKGDSVRKMQSDLASIFFYPEKGAPNNGIDGVYGPKTQNAVERFQSTISSLTVDGVYGPNTHAELQKRVK